MNDNAKLWVATLRSDIYTQGKGALHDIVEDKYCCLGVACKLFTGKLEKNVQWPYMYYGDTMANDLPDKVREWLNLSSRSGRYSGSSLICDNDSGATFEEIADLIESEPKGLFNE